MVTFLLSEGLMHRITSFFIFLSMFTANSSSAQISADHWNGGAIRIGPSTTGRLPASMGAVRYDEGQNVLKFCDGATWRTIGATIAGGDTTPNAFSFTNLTGQPLGAIVYSNTITITGIDPDQVVNITGSGSPAVSINGGAWASNGFISSGDTLQIRQVTAASVSTSRTATVTVGSSSVNWTVTTRAGALVIFTTNVTVAGNFGGVSGGDMICQNQASLYGLSGTYKAVLSDSTTHAKDRLTLSYPIVNTNNDIVFSYNMWNQTLENGIRMANNSMPGSTRWAWSGTVRPDGLATARLCSDWASTAGDGTATETVTGYGGVMMDNASTCATGRPMLCIQQ